MDKDTMTQRLWRVYSTNTASKQSVLPHLKQAEPKRSLFREVLLKLMPLRTVYASEEPDPQPKTSMDKLAAAQPKILVSDEEVREYLSKETGRDRVSELFNKGADGNPHPDLLGISFIIQSSAGLVFIMTSVAGAKAAREAFLTKQHRVFETKFKAQRAYNDALMIGAFKFGGKWAIKTLMFSTIFLFTSQAIATYRNKTSLLEYIAAGALTGSVLRINLGLRGFFAGGVIGSAIGTLGGIMFYFTQTATGETQQQRHYWRVQEKLRHEKEMELLKGSKPAEASSQTTNQVSEPLPT